MLTDTHCHLFYDDLKNDLKGVLDRANQLGVTRFICVGTNIEDSRECLSIAEENKNIFSSIGIHPHDAKDALDGYITDIYTLMEYEKMVAVGEIGLDYFRNISNHDVQKKVFREQMKVARELKRRLYFITVKPTKM